MRRRSAAFLVGAWALAGCGPTESALGTSAFALRPTDPAVPQGELRFDANETVESVTSPAGRVRVHFTRNGRNEVPSADTDISGIPDYPELVARSYDEVRAHYHGVLGFREPVSDALLGGVGDGGDDLFDVYLVDFAGRADGAYRRDACELENPSICTGHMLQENDFAGYGYPSLAFATRVLSSHEYFHAVQGAYDADQDVVLSEGTAVWATEQFDPTLGDFEAFIPAFLERTDRPLNVVSGGVVDAKSYGTAIFFQFLHEFYEGDVVRALLEATVDGANGVPDPEWFTELGPFLGREHASTFPDALRTFSIWNLYTFDRNDPNRSYANARGYPRVTMEAVSLPFLADRPRYFQASTKYYTADPAGRAEVTAALVVPPGEEAELADVSLILSAINVNIVSTPVQIVDLTAGVETIDTTTADEVILMVVNTALEGPSRRPSVCFGAPAQVAACRDMVLAGPGADAGTEPAPDAQAPMDAATGAPDAGLADAGTMEDEGGCSNSGPSEHAPLLCFGLLLLLLRRRTGTWNRRA